MTPKTPNDTILQTLCKGFEHTCVHRKRDLIPFIKTRSNIVLPDLSMEEVDETHSNLVMAYDEPLRVMVTWSSPKQLVGETSAMTYTIVDIAIN